MVDHKLNRYELFHPLEVVSRNNGKQLQMGDNLNDLN